jgi:DNA-binding transcriptional LysR family regulator
LSPAGQLFLSDARRILQDVDEAKRRAEQIALGKAGTLRIGIATALSWHGIVADSFREFRRRQPDVEFVLHHMLSVHPTDAVLSGRLDAGFAAAITPWHKDVAHSQFARERLVLAVPKGHPLTQRERIRLRDLRDMPFVWTQRWANPAFNDQLMQACARGSLSAPRIVQEATDRDTQLGFVQCRIVIAWLTESTRWHCPRGIVSLPVVDMNLRLPFNPEEGQFVAFAAEVCGSSRSERVSREIEQNHSATLDRLRADRDLHEAMAATDTTPALRDATTAATPAGRLSTRERRHEAMPVCPHGRRIGGTRIRDFARAWRSACRKAGVPGRLRRDSTVRPCVEW